MMCESFILSSAYKHAPKLPLFSIIMASKNLRFVLEMTKICNDPIPNVYVSPSLNDITLWNGVVFPQSGYFQGGIFRFNIQFDGENRSKVPKVVFETDIYHPLVDPHTLELNMLPRLEHQGQRQKKELKPRVMDLLQYIKDVLISDIKYWHNNSLIFNKECFQSYLDYVSQDPSSKTNKHPFIQSIQKCVRCSVDQKDSNVDTATNPIILEDTGNDPRNRGHSQIILENLKTFKNPKEIEGLLDSMRHIMQ